MVIHHRWNLRDECWFIGNSLGILAISNCSFEGKPHTLTWTGGMIRCFFWGWIFRVLSASVSFTGKARWQCPRALCTDCRHAISLWSPERISKMNWSLYGLWWFGNTASGLDRIEELLQQKVWVCLCHFLGWNEEGCQILKHIETSCNCSWPSFIMTVLDCPQVHESSKSDKYEDTWGFSRNAASCWVFIWSDLECFSDLLNPGKSSIHSFHVISHMSPQDSTRPSWVDSKCPKSHPGHTDHQLWAIAHTTASHVGVSCVSGFFIVLLGMDLTLKLGLLSTWNTWTRCWLFFLVPHPWCQFRLFHDVTSPFLWFYLVFVSPYGSLWIYDDLMMA